MAEATVIALKNNMRATPSKDKEQSTVSLVDTEIKSTSSTKGKGGKHCKSTAKKNKEETSGKTEMTRSSSSTSTTSIIADNGGNNTSTTSNKDTSLMMSSFLEEIKKQNETLTKNFNKQIGELNRKVDYLYQYDDDYVGDEVPSRPIHYDEDNDTFVTECTSNKRTYHDMSESEDESVLSAQKPNSDLPQSAEKSDTVFSNYAKKFKKDLDMMDSEVNSDLAEMVNDTFREDDKYNEMIKKIHRPSNCEALKETRVNSGVWSSLKPTTQTEDSKMRGIQNAVIKASVNLVKILDKGGSDLDSQSIEWGMDSLAILGQANKWINLRRRESHKRDIDPRLCSSTIPFTDQLYGDNVIKDIKDIQEINRISRKVGGSNQTFSQNRYSNNRVRGSGRPAYRGNPSRGRFNRYQRPRFNGYNNTNGTSSSGSQSSSKKLQDGAQESIKFDIKSVGQVKTRTSRMFFDSSLVDNAELVPGFDGSTNRQSIDNTEKENSSYISRDTQNSPSSQQTTADGLSYIRSSLEGRNLSSRSAQIIMSAWRSSTQKQYSTYIQKWIQFCVQREIDFLQSSIDSVVDFLTSLFDSGLSYSALNTTRSALSALGLVQDGFAIGSHPLINKFMKGVYNLRPSQSRYCETWDVSVVLNYLRKLSPVKNLSLKLLSYKLAMLIALTLASRTQSLHLLSIRDMKKGYYSHVLQYSGLLKQSRSGKNNPVAELKAYPPDRRLCVVFTLKEYLSRTSELRKTENSLFISFIKPYKPVSKMTISRWLRQVMSKSGIDCDKYKSHSIRSAATSKAKAQFVPIENILQVAGWTNTKTFAMFYDKKIVENTVFSDAVLSL